MKTVQTIVLIIHIISGFTALTSGIIPMLAKKGGYLHIITGKIFVAAMYGVSLTATLMFIVKPFSSSLLFLLFIGIFSFYLTFTGVRAVQHNKLKYKTNIMDWVVLGVILVCGLCMVSFSIYYFLQKNFLLGPLYIVFGYFSLSFFYRDSKILREYNNIIPEKMAWFYRHMGRILGAYIATFTAFCVVNVHFLPPLAVWFIPGAIGAIGVSKWIRYYKLKFGTTTF